MRVKIFKTNTLVNELKRRGEHFLFIDESDVIKQLEKFNSIRIQNNLEPVSLEFNDEKSILNEMIPLELLKEKLIHDAMDHFFTKMNQD